MNPARPEPPRQSRATVLTMPPRPSSPSREPTAPPGDDHPQQGEEPGYGHGV